MDEETGRCANCDEDEWNGEKCMYCGYTGVEFVPDTDE